MIQVKEVMTKTPSMVSAETTIQFAAEIMQKDDCGCVIVQQQGKPLGILTDRDIVVWAIARHLDPNTAKVEEAMSAGVISCNQELSVELAADMMADNDIRRLVVLNNDGIIVGIVSLADLMKSSDNQIFNDNVIHHLFRYA